MPREYAPIPLKLQGEDDFRALTVAEQHLYFVLSTSPSLSHAGVADWRPKRLAKLAVGWTQDAVEAAAAGLQAAGRIVVDEDTEEVLVRDHISSDGILKQPNMSTAMANAHAAIASPMLRGVLIHDLQVLHDADPAAKGWGSAAAKELLTRTSVYPSGKGSRKGSDRGSVDRPVEPNPTPSVEGSDKGCPKPEPSPEPSPEPTSSRRSPRGSRLPEDWQPSRELIGQMRDECPGLDVQAEHLKFRDYWIGKPGKDATKADWPATWRNWMRNARDRGGAVIPLQAANGTSPWDRR
jgi:hypothetical protein